MKKSITLSGIMLLTCLMTLTLPGCDKNNTVVEPTQVLSGCTDPAAENYDPLATESNGLCIYVRDKFIGAYTILSLECSAAYSGFISQLTALKIRPYESHPDLIHILFPDDSDALFGIGRISGSTAWAISIKTSNGTNHAELHATFHNGMLWGRFEITGTDQSNIKKIATCHFVARKTE